MPVLDVSDRSPLRSLPNAVGGALSPGDVVLAHARAGVGKSAFLVHLALERLLRGERVLHVALRDSVQGVRDAYESGLSGLTRGVRPLDRADALLAVERNRLIHVVPSGEAGRVAFVDRLQGLLDTFRDALEFAPVLVVVDGLEPSEDDVRGLQQLAATSRLVVVDAFSATRDVPGVDGALVVELVSDRSGVALHVRRNRQGAAGAVPVRLDAALFFAREEAPLPEPGHAVTAAECTLHSGGAAGAEAAFGECAERWGVREMNYTFDGHAQARTRGAYPLTEQALAQGDVSLAYVSRRLRRSYSESNVIRRVLQSLWHQVSGAQEIFVIGAIQEDGTVTGGTGWSVELARMWNKRIWVFDQDKDTWFRWNGDDWVDAVPSIETSAFCGTGTRSLAPNGREAIEALYARSFGEPRA